MAEKYIMNDDERFKMGDKYKETGPDPLADLMWQEDREVENNLYKAQARYFLTCAEINDILLRSLKSMTDEELKDVLKNNLRIPVVRQN